MEDAKAFADETFHVKYAIESAAEKAAMDDDELDGEEKDVAARTGFNKVTGLVQDRIDFVRDTWPSFFGAFSHMIQGGCKADLLNNFSLIGTHFCR